MKHPSDLGQARFEHHSQRFVADLVTSLAMRTAYVVIHLYGCSGMNTHPPLGDTASSYQLQVHSPQTIIHRWMCRVCVCVYVCVRIYVSGYEL